MKRLSPDREIKGTETTPVEPLCESPQRKADVDEKWQEDPGDLLSIEADLEAGGTYRKKTSSVLQEIKKKISATVTKDVQISKKVEFKRRPWTVIIAVAARKRNKDSI